MKIHATVSKVDLSANEKLTVTGPNGESYRLYCDGEGDLHAFNTTPNLTDAEKGMVERNEMISAIKSYRNRSGQSLVQSKDVCEAYRSALRGVQG